MKTTGRKSIPATDAKTPLTLTIPELVQSGADGDFRELISVMYGALGRLQTMRRTLAEALDLGSAEFAVVMSLLRFEGAANGVRIREIADDIYVAAANVTATVGRLEEMQWVAKTTDPTDSRALAVRLTPVARAKMEQFIDQLRIVNDTWFRGTTPPEIDAVISLFGRLIEQYEPALATAKSIARRSAKRS